jgi:microsomal dipeptidase-like Zn-dependent dipeptidase
MGVSHVGIGSDLVQGQPDSVVEWMRTGRWSKPEAGAVPATFPPPVPWFADNTGLAGIAEGLRRTGFAESEVEAIMGGNWLGFFERSFGPA